MKKSTVVILLILFVPLIAYYFLSKNENISVVEAQVNGPQMIIFASRMCYDCQRLESVVKEVYPMYQDKVKLTEISVQDNSSAIQSMIKKYQIKLVPTSIFIDEKGDIKAKVEGYIDNNALKNHLEEISDNG